MAACSIHDSAYFGADNADKFSTYLAFVGQHLTKRKIGVWGSGEVVNYFAFALSMCACMQHTPISTNIIGYVWHM